MECRVGEAFLESLNKYLNAGAMNEHNVEAKDIKEICLRYFRGESTLEDERFIHERLSDGSLSMDDFRSMEKDWLRKAVEQVVVTGSLP